MKNILKRFLIPIIYPLARWYWFIFRPKTRGVKCLVVNNGKFLLVRLNYAHRRWTVPGGGVNSSETYADAAVREIHEETGLVIANPVFIGQYEHVIEYKRDTVEVYTAETSENSLTLDSVEIKEAGWFLLTDLPQDRTVQTDKILKMFNEYLA